MTNVPHSKYSLRENSKFWKNFESKHKNDKDGGFEELDDLKRTLGTFPADKQIHFIDAK